jgi:hypothetical protein
MEAEILSTWSLEETAAFFHSMELHVRKDFYAQQHIPGIAQVGAGVSGPLKGHRRPIIRPCSGGLRTGQMLSAESEAASAASAAGAGAEPGHQPLRQALGEADQGDH